jgi:hypothetical protein
MLSALVEIPLPGDDVPRRRRETVAAARAWRRVVRGAVAAGDPLPYSDAKKFNKRIETAKVWRGATENGP